MAKRKKIKPAALIAMIALAAVVCVALIFVLTNRKANTADGSENGTAQEPQVIETEGDIEIIIPDDQESGGF